MAIEDTNRTDLIRGKGKSQPAPTGLVKGPKQPNTIQTYQTKGYKHEGVSGSESVDRLNETKVGIAITPAVMTENNSPVEKIVKDDVSGKATGAGMPADSGKVKR